MQELIIIAITAAFINNVVLSQFLASRVSRRFQKGGDGGGHGRRGNLRHYHRVLLCRSDLRFYSGSAECYISADNRIYPGYCGAGTVRRDVPEKIQPGTLQCPGRISAADYDQLRGSGCCPDNVQRSYNLLESVVNGFATAVGFAVAIVLMAGVREKTEYNDVPESFKGMPIVVLTACLMSIAFFGFSGLK